MIKNNKINILANNHTHKLSDTFIQNYMFDFARRLFLWITSASKLSLATVLHGENFMAIFNTLSVVIWFSTGTLRIFATLFYVFTMRVVIYDTLSMATIPTLSTSILFCDLCYILLWISPRSVIKIAIRI